MLLLHPANVLDKRKSDSAKILYVREDQGLN